MAYGRARPPKLQITDAADDAATFLRRAKYANVFRCDIKCSEIGKDTWADMHNKKLSDDDRIPHRGKGYYFVAGKGVMPVDAMVDLARTVGFER